MKKLALALLCLLSATEAVASKKPNPADYTVDVHVVGSANRSVTQHLLVIIDGQCMELTSTAGLYGGLLALGDYKAKFIDYAPKTHATYDYWHEYEFYFPSDGAVRTYYEVAIGTPAASCAGGATSDAQ